MPISALALLGLAGLDAEGELASGMRETEEAFVEEEAGGERTDSDEADEALEMERGRLK